jgi:hypothetical protein
VAEYVWSWFETPLEAMDLRRFAIRRPRFGRRLLARLLLCAVSLYAALFTVRVVARKYYVFLPGYVRWRLTAAASPNPARTHVLFLYADHFEPDGDAARTRQWLRRYAALAARHRDAEGRVLQHTWFYPGDQPNDAIMSAMSAAVADGLGEVELHLHHFGDTADTLRPKLRAAIVDFQRFGFLRSIDGRTNFSFVHGNSGLDNSNGEYCGVTDELRLLRELGCYADFTFPSLFLASQPPTVNSIYAARDDSGPKSYRRAWPLAQLETGAADLMIFQGPLLLAPSRSARRLFVDVEDGNVHPTVPITAARVDHWIAANVHVPERPDWVFVKVFGHAASSAVEMDATLGDDFERGLRYLETRYNDGRRYVLHHVTAREAYNVARAAASGARGDNPAEYYDFVIPPYEARASMPGLPAVRGRRCARTSRVGE